MSNATKPDFSYRLTESLLYQQRPVSTISTSTQTPLQQGIPRQSSTPKFIVTSPANDAIVLQPKDSESSFNQYIGTHFKEDAPVLLDRLQVASPRTPTPTNNNKDEEESTFWSYLSKDLEAGDKPEEKSSSAANHDKTSHEHLNTWYEYDSIFTTTSSLMEKDAPQLFSMGAFFFLFGFICPPSWWVGSFYPSKPRDKMDSRWKLLNRFFSLGFSTLLVVALIVLAIVYSKTA
jgi:hypothetical protein